MKLNLLFLFLFVACGKSATTPLPAEPERMNIETTLQDPLKDIELITPSSAVIRTSLAYKAADKRKGLSGVRSEAFDEDQGKLFFYFSDARRTFWMRETYFNLDIIYLDKNLTIIEMVRDLPFYEGRRDSRIPRAPSIRSRHVLEMKANSPISSQLSLGDQLQWRSSLSMEETARRMKSLK
jgi:uncharacterized membrane protein (UPF0127 family)